MLNIATDNSVLHAYKRLFQERTPWYCKAIVFLTGIMISQTSLGQNTFYTTNWLGNSGATNSLYVQEEMHNLWVSAEGTSYACTWWDEDHRQIGVYSSNGVIQPRLTDIPFGSDIGGNSTAVFAAETTVLYRFQRSDGMSTGNITVPGNAIRGITATDTEVFVSSLNGFVYVYNASTLAVIRNFSVEGSGRMALDGAGFLWIITNNTSLKCYSSMGTLQAQSITLPTGNIASAVAVNSVTNTLYVIDAGSDQNIKVYNNVATNPTRATDFGAIGGIYSGARPGLAGSQRFSFSIVPDTETEIPGHTFGMCGVGVDNSNNLYVLYGSNSAGRIEKYNALGTFQWRLIGHTFEEGAYIDPTTDETDVYAGENHYKMDYSAPANTEMASWYGTVSALYGSNGYSTVARPGRGFASLSPIRIASIAGSKFIYMSAQRGGIYVFGMPGNSETFTNSNITDDTPVPLDGSISDVDANGTLWSGDHPDVIDKYLCSGVSDGKPVYSLNSPITYPIPAPYSSGPGYVGTKYISETDVMYITGQTSGISGSNVSRYNNWTASRTLVFTVDLMFNNENITSMDVAGDYIFTDYFGSFNTSGPAFGLVKVWNANTGAFVMDIKAPANYNAGDSDNKSNTRAFKRSNGEYVITFLDHVQNKTVVFRWCPSCPITIVDVVGVTITPPRASLRVGANTSLTATIEPGNATNKTVTWSSSNESVATVSTSGIVMGMSVGTTEITATTEDGGKTSVIEVSVSQPLTVRYTSRDLTIDGNLTESSWNLNKLIAKPTGGIQNNEGHFDLMWDAAYLYVGAIIKDTQVMSSPSNSPWENDAIEIYLDGNQNKGNTYDNFDIQIIKSMGSTSVWTSRSALGIKSAIVLIDGGYSVEVAIPWNIMKAKAVAGLGIGFDISYDDNDTGSRDGTTTWHGDDGNFNNTSKFDDLILLEGIVTGTGNAVEKTNITVYPNPSNEGFITIDLHDDLKAGIEHVEVIDLMGRSLYNSGQLSNVSKVTLNTHGYSKGTYIIKVSKGQQMVIKKLIIGQ
jgi:hypothetical protein